MSESEAKTHPASDRKLQKKREEGQIASSAEPVSLFVTAIFLGIVLGMGSDILSHAAAPFTRLTEQISGGFDKMFTEAFSIWRVTVGWFIGVFLGGAAALAFLMAVIVNGGPTGSLKPLAPQFTKLSPKSGIKRIFGYRGLIENAASLVRALIWIVAAGLFIWLALQNFAILRRCPLDCSVATGLGMLRQLIFSAIIILLIFAFIEIRLQKKIFLHENRMTKSEVKRERKESFGSDEVRKERARLRSQTRNEDPTTQKVSNATVVFVSEEAASAVYYKPGEGRAPVVTKNGKGATAKAALIEQARASGIPIVANAALAEQLLSTPRGETAPEEAFGELAIELSKLLR